MCLCSNTVDSNGATTSMASLSSASNHLILVCWNSKRNKTYRIYRIKKIWRDESMSWRKANRQPQSNRFFLLSCPVLSSRKALPQHNTAANHVSLCEWSVHSYVDHQIWMVDLGPVPTCLPWPLYDFWNIAKRTWDGFLLISYLFSRLLACGE